MFSDRSDVKEKNILIAGISDPQKFYRVFLRVNALMFFRSMHVCTVNDVAIQCLTALAHDNLFDLIIIGDQLVAGNKKCLTMNDAVKIIRTIPACKNVPIIVISSQRLINTYERIGVSAWMHPFGVDVADFEENLECVLNTLFDHTNCDNGGSWFVFKGSSVLQEVD